jgi:hypothetical protein
MFVVLIHQHYQMTKHDIDVLTQILGTIICFIISVSCAPNCVIIVILNYVLSFVIFNHSTFNCLCVHLQKNTVDVF